MGWLRKHPRLYAIGGGLMLAGGALATAASIWSLFSSDPLIPVLIQVLPTSQKWLVILGFAALTIGGLIILIKIFRQTRQVNPIQIPESIPMITQGLSSDEATYLLEHKGELATGMAWYGAKNEILENLCIKGIIEQTKRRQAAGPHVYDQIYFVLSDSGKQVVTQMERWPQNVSLIVTLNAWGIGIAGHRGYPGKQSDEIWWLRLEVSVDSAGRPIDRIDLVIDDNKPIHAHNWTRQVESHFNLHFDISEWRDKGTHQIELVAYCGDKVFRTVRKPVDFDMEPFGRHIF